MTSNDMHDALNELAAAINRLRPDWRDAQDFYSLRSGAEAQRNQEPVAPST
jgi:hypothetical protein